MSFSTVLFFAFLIASVLVYYLLPKKCQWVWLLVVSYVYYFSFSVKTSVYLVFTTLVTYAGGRLLDKFNKDSAKYLADNKETLDKDAKKAYKEKVKKKKRAVVWIMVLAAFGLLAALKYGYFIVSNIDAFVLFIGHGQYFEPPKIILPLGISFYTFQSMSYIIDVYQGKYESQKNVFKYALFVSFFPQLLQGPIGRYNKLAHQLYEGHSFELIRIQHGFERILWGLFKKMVLADRVQPFVLTVFSNYGEYGGWYNIMAALMYTVQLYADFSGGIDIVIGTAEMFGITMDENFKQPFFSKSIGEFWRRWHITLGTWMKDYIFYPFALSGMMSSYTKHLKKRFGQHTAKVLPICIGNLLVFFVVGVWHGAEWRYIGYGMYNGIIIAASSLLEPVYKKMFEVTHIKKDCGAWKVFSMFRTFVLVVIGFYFDMAAGFGAAIEMMVQSVTRFSFSQFKWDTIAAAGLTFKDFIIVIFGCLIILLISVLKEKGIKIREALDRKPLVVRWAVYYLLIMGTIFLGSITASTGFLYANF